MTQRYETFSFLPALTGQQIQRQIAAMLRNGLVPMLEYADEYAHESGYWNLWQPEKGMPDTPGQIMKEVDMCGGMHPDCYIRISGYNKRTRMFDMSFMTRAPLEVA